MGRFWGRAEGSSGCSCSWFCRGGCPRCSRAKGATGWGACWFRAAAAESVAAAADDSAVLSLFLSVMIQVNPSSSSLALRPSVRALFLPFSRLRCCSRCFETHFPSALFCSYCCGTSQLPCTCLYCTSSASLSSHSTLCRNENSNPSSSSLAFRSSVMCDGFPSTLSRCCLR